MKSMRSDGGGGGEHRDERDITPNRRRPPSLKMGENVVRALNGVSMQVRKGDYLTIMGRSGSGKSTMLNLLGCLDRPTAGEYRVGGRDVSKLDDDALSNVRGHEIGFIFQSFNLIPQLTVLENLEVPLFYQR